jgi:hypothetical protein
MFLQQLDPAGTLGSRQLKVIKAKLRNPDAVSAVPVYVVENMLRIGYDEEEFADDWEFIGRKLGYHVHFV